MSLPAPEITYRTADRSDSEALAAFGRRTFTATFAHLYKPEDLNTYLNRVYTPAAMLADMAIPGTEFRLAERGRQIIGFCKIGAVTVPLRTIPPRSIELRQLYVDHAFHGTGVAATLMAWALDRAHARGCEHVFLSVYSENYRAQRFYHRHGFVVIGDYKFMVGKQADDELIMHLMIRHTLDTPRKDPA
ncbi:N-acetyltransferase family protein [Pedomonas sp. V897]|uniref:GNAT family N-acetyltransferase n=1 Tax=Pedomonas sp. V897 TaxID=3446482 RepID=UPI003EDFB464